MSDFSSAVQTAVYDALRGAVPAIAGGRIFDSVAQNVAFPYVEIGEGQSIPDDTTGDIGGSDDGISEFVDLHVWSRYRGKKEAKDIISRIHDVLHGVSLPVEGRSSAHAWIRNVRIFTDADGVTRHGVVSVEIIHRS